MRRLIVLLVPFCLASHGAAANELEAKKAALIAEMNKYDCQMTTPQADISMPQLGITRPEAIAIAALMRGEGIAKFGDDEETLILLPPACKT